MGRIVRNFLLLGYQFLLPWILLLERMIMSEVLGSHQKLEEWTARQKKHELLERSVQFYSVVLDCLLWNFKKLKFL